MQQKRKYDLKRIYQYFRFKKYCCILLNTLNSIFSHISLNFFKEFILFQIVNVKIVMKSQSSDKLRTISVATNAN